MVDPRLYPDCLGAACAAHARRNFEELAHDGTSVVGLEAVRRFARIYGVEAQLKELSDDERRAQRHQLAKPLWEELRQWLQLERRLVADGGPTAKAIDYTLGHWAALTRHLDDGAVAIDNNHLERQIKPWAMGRKAWMFVGSELAGQRAAIVMSLVQSARLNGHNPWAYLRDVLQRLAVRIEVEVEETRLARGEEAALVPLRDVVVVPGLLVGHPLTWGVRNCDCPLGANDHGGRGRLMRSRRGRSYS